MAQPPSALTTPTGLAAALNDPYVSAIESDLTLLAFSPIRPRRHARMLAHEQVPPSWAAWQAPPALYALLDRIVRLRAASPSQLAARLGLARCTVSRQLRTLEERRLIVSERHFHRRREVVVTPTVHGHNALRQLREVRRSHIATHLEGWSDSDKQLLASLIRRLAGHKPWI